MTCETCGDKPKKDRHFPSAVVEINNPESLVLLRKVVIPASLGDDTAVPPAIGKYRNVILQYEANGHLYLYSSDGIPTKIDSTVPQEVLDRITELELDVDLLETSLAVETDARERADQGLQQEIDDLKNSPDVVDIVATYADLMAYDTSSLGDKDVIRVLADETHEGQSDYYRWNTTTRTWTFIGTVGNYYTKDQIDSLLDGKQDELTPGENVSIVDESGELVISAQDTTYTAGYGLELNGTEFSVDSSVVQDTLVAGDNITIEDESGSLVISATDTTYTFDSTPTAGSTNPVTSEGIKSYVDTKTVTFKPFPASVATTGTTQQFMDSVLALHPETGMAYLGTVSLSDMPAGLLQEEVEVYIYSDYVVYCIMRSTDVSPYAWWCASYNYQGWRPVNTDTTYSAGSGLNLTGTTFSVDSATIPTKSELDVALAGKQDVLTAGDNITIMDESGALVISAEGGGVIELTSADYNWPTDNPDGVALWLLDNGIYHRESGVKIYRANGLQSPAPGFIVEKTTSGYAKILALNTTLAVFETAVSNGQSTAANTVLDTNSVVQTTGTSTTDVMSQNATTSMVFADPSTKNRIQLGNGALTSANKAISLFGIASKNHSVAIGGGATGRGEQSIAIGNGADTGNDVNSSVALGAGSQCQYKGEVNIGSSNNYQSGYNNSDYRLLTGLYDGQSAHDAVNKGQLDTAVTNIGLELDGKQDELTAGTGISIADESGALVISATGAQIATINAQDWSALWQ